VNLLEKQLSTVYLKDVRFPWVTLYNYACPTEPYMMLPKMKNQSIFPRRSPT